MQINLFITCFCQFAKIISYYIVYLIIYREKIKRCTPGGAVGAFLISWVQSGISWVRSLSRGCVPYLVGVVWYLVGVILISWVCSSSRGCSLVSRGVFLISWVPAAYIQTDPGRRAGGKHLRAARVSRLNEGSRVFPEIGISLIINYLSSPIGR